MNKWVTSLAMAAAAMLCACAAPTNQATDDPPEDKVYRTGSHIPARDPVGTSTKSASQDSVDSLMRNRAPVVPASSGR